MKTRNIFSLLLAATVTVSGLTGCEDADPCNGKPYYILNRLGSGNLQTDISNDQVNMLFQVLDENRKGRPGLVDLGLYELIDFDKDMTQSAEAQVKIDSFGSIPITVNSILCLDLSASVAGLVPQIKQSALAFVNTSIAEQRIAIYTFDGNTPVLHIDFTNNKTQLAAAINALPETGLGTSTNLYEAVMTAANKLPAEQYSTSQIVQGNILLFTDGEEMARPLDRSEAISATADRTVFSVALASPDLDEETLKLISGEDNYFKANNINELETRFREIQNDIRLLSRSVYWMYYNSPRKGNSLWNVELRFRENCNEVENSIYGQYSSNGF